MKPEILFLKQEDVIAAGALDMEKILELVERTFYLEGIGEINNPPKTVFGIPDDEKRQSRFFTMPVYIRGDVNRPGVKWAAESDENAKGKILPMGIDLLILSDPVTVLPVAILDGMVITAMRTAAAAGVAAKYLAPGGAETAGCVGAGVIGRTMIIALKHVLPNLKKVKLTDLNLEKAKSLAAEFDGQIEVEPVDSVKDAVYGQDVIATMTTSRKPFVKTEWVKQGCMVIQMSSYEVEEGVVSLADKVVVDSWDQIKENTASVLLKMLQKGKLDENSVIQLKDIVCGNKPGRRSDVETTLFSSRGLGCLDIMVGDYIYKNAMEKGIGQKLVLWDEPKWV